MRSFYTVVKLVSLSLCLTFTLTNSNAQKIDSVTGKIDSVAKRIILIGDAGVLEMGTHPFLNMMSKSFNLDDKKNPTRIFGSYIFNLCTRYFKYNSSQTFLQQLKKNYQREKLIFRASLNVSIPFSFNKTFN